MKEYRLVGVLAAALFLLCLTGIAKAQTTQPPGKRSTPCDSATPNNAICVYWTPAAVNVDGSPTVLPQVFRIEQQFNGSATWTTVATGLTSTRYYAKNLPLGTYIFRVYQNCTGSTGCTESAPTASNAKDSTAPVIQPGPPTQVLVVKVTITSDHSPVYRILTPTTMGTTVYGLVPVGRPCDVFVTTYRGKRFHRVHVEPTELWGTTSTDNLAAPCG